MGEFSFRSASAMHINLKPSVGSVQQTTSKLQAVVAAANHSQTLPPPSRSKATNGITARAAGAGNQRGVSKPGKYRTTIALADPGTGARETTAGNHSRVDGHAGRPLRHKPGTTNGVSTTGDNRFYTDNNGMKGLPPPPPPRPPPRKDDTYGSFDPPPPLKFTANGHSETIAESVPPPKHHAVLASRRPPMPEPGERAPSAGTQVSAPGAETRLGEPVPLTNGVGGDSHNGDIDTCQEEDNHAGIEPHHRFFVRELSSQGSEAVDALPGDDGTEEHPLFTVGRNVKKPDTYKNELQIVSAKGTVRGFKNRVRAGIAVFRQQNDGVRNYRAAEKDQVVLYTTSMMIVRSTHEKCIRVKKILQTHMVQYVEKDIFMSRENQRELMLRVGREEVEVPQVFADGQHLGGAEELTGLNECGELRKIFKHFKKVFSGSSCEKCGGYRYIPCTSCHGSKKSLHRNHFTAEFCALRCIVCDENGLIQCEICAPNDVS